MVTIQDGCSWVKLGLYGFLPSFMDSYAEYLYEK